MKCYSCFIYLQVTFFCCHDNATVLCPMYCNFAKNMAAEKNIPQTSELCRCLALDLSPAESSQLNIVVFFQVSVTKEALEDQLMHWQQPLFHGDSSTHSSPNTLSKTLTVTVQQIHIQTEAKQSQDEKEQSNNRLHNLTSGSFRVRVKKTQLDLFSFSQDTTYLCRSYKFFNLS